MRLRYLYLPDLPPLSQVRIVFGPGAPPLMERACAIRFIVGVNGTGKSRLLQAIAEIFLTLEAPRLPGFPFAIAYDLGEGESARTLYIRHLEGSPTQAMLIEFNGLLPDDTDWWSVADWDGTNTHAPPIQHWVVEDQESGWKPMPSGEARVRKRFDGRTLPSMRGGYLPVILLAYTSGDLHNWHTLFRGAALNPTLDPAETGERPYSWTYANEQSYWLNQGIADQPLPLSQAERAKDGLGLLMTPARLKLALFGVALHRAADEFRQLRDEASEARFLTDVEEQPDDLRRILNSVDWLWPVTLSLRVDLAPERLTEIRRDVLRRLYKVSAEQRLVTTVIRDPEPATSRLLVYDLLQPLAQAPSHQPFTLHTLLEAIAGSSDTEGGQASALSGASPGPTAFDLFRQLAHWQDDGLLLDISMTVQKRHTDDLLLYDWLSDGEKVFLGRMALFHLLKGQGDALILLDEPETHFNDKWKREIVAMIDDALGNDRSDVIISTHSSITLSDVTNEEIELLRRKAGRTVADDVRSLTFGAEPGEIMVHLWNAEDSIGERSRKYLDDLLEKNWTVADIEQLEQILGVIAAGFHRSELRSILRGLRALQS